MRESATKILKENNLRITSQRISILRLLMADRSKAFSSSELLKFLGKDMNRSTIYRALETLSEKGLVYKMVDINGDTIYGLSRAKNCNHSVHPHLKCNECGILECLPAFPLDYVNRLQQSGVDGLNVVLGGVCTNCSHN